MATYFVTQAITAVWIYYVVKGYLVISHKNINIGVIWHYYKYEYYTVWRGRNYVVHLGKFTTKDGQWGLLIRWRPTSACYENCPEHALPQGHPIRMQGARVQGYATAAGRCTDIDLPLDSLAIGRPLRKYPVKVTLTQKCNHPIGSYSNFVRIFGSWFYFIHFLNHL